MANMYSTFIIGAVLGILYLLSFWSSQEHQEAGTTNFTHEETQAH